MVAVRVGDAWDAVRASDEIGIRALAALGERSGSVIGDAFTRSLYWLVPVGSAAGWPLPGVQILSATPPGVIRFVEVPPAGIVRGPGPHWLVPYRHDAYLTEARALHTALRQATAADTTGSEYAR